MAESVVKSKMRSESLYVDSFSAFQLLRYNSFLAPTDSRQYGLALFKDLDRIDPPFGTAGYPHEVNHQNDTANVYADQIAPVEIAADLAENDHRRPKHVSARFPITTKCRSIDDFGRLVPDKKHPELMANNRLATDNPMRISPSLSSGFGPNLHYLFHRRQRGEKRNIPDEQKDEKYFERRKRNNEAAKKSRDARKIREDRIALRAAILEQENNILRIQVSALRKELATLQQIVCSRPNV